LAKFLSSVFTDVRGSIGGITFGINKGVMTAKVKPNPARRMRTTQPSNRAILGWMSRIYGGLSSTNRALWETWAANHPVVNSMGQSVKLSGHQWFIKLNSVARRIGGVGVESDTPPLTDLQYSVNDFAAVTGSVDPGDIDLTWEVDGDGDAGDFVEIGIAGPFASPARVEVHNKFKSLQTVAGNLELDTIADLVEGAWYWIRARYVGADGQTSAWQVAQATPKTTP